MAPAPLSEVTARCVGDGRLFVTNTLDRCGLQSAVFRQTLKLVLIYCDAVRETAGLVLLHFSFRRPPGKRPALGANSR